MFPLSFYRHQHVQQHVACYTGWGTYWCTSGFVHVPVEGAPAPSRYVSVYTKWPKRTQLTQVLSLMSFYSMSHWNCRSQAFCYFWATLCKVHVNRSSCTTCQKEKEKIEAAAEQQIFSFVWGKSFQIWIETDERTVLGCGLSYAYFPVMLYLCFTWHGSISFHKMQCEMPFMIQFYAHLTVTVAVLQEMAIGSNYSTKLPSPFRRLIILSPWQSSVQTLMQCHIW